MDSEKQCQHLKQNAESLRRFSSGPFPSSIAKLSGSSRGIPSDKNFHFYYNFDEFKSPIKEISRASHSVLESIGLSSEHLWAKDLQFPDDDDDDAYDWLVNVNDEVFERFDVCVAEFKELRKREEDAGVRLTGLEDITGNGFQLVYGKKKKSVVEKGKDDISSGLVKVSSRENNVGGAKPKVPFHISSIPRPQDAYKIIVNNANQRFEHVWLQKSEDGSRSIHPLENFSVLDFVDKNVGDVELVKPPPLECAPFKLVEEVKDLKEMAAKLRGVVEFAVDLEHNQYRSFQGLTCLMQISTRTEDFIVDTLKLRIHVGPYLRELFKDPSKKKVMHGADRDVVWLQRDFGIYICNLFDTGQASRVMKLERNSLEYLLKHFCGVRANKEYQNADWRLRPLPEEMIRYAREDTHYLLHIYDLMRLGLLSPPAEFDCSEDPLVEVYKRSYEICMQLYEKEVLTDSSYLYIYGLQTADFNAQQLAIVAGLYEWRDGIARAEDESTGYILPNKSLLEIAKQMPVTTSKLRHVLKSKHPYMERNLGSVVSIIRHSIQNAAAFEAVANQLKEARIEAESARNAINGVTTTETVYGINVATESSSGQPSVSMEFEEKSSKVGTSTTETGKDLLNGTSMDFLLDGVLQNETNLNSVTGPRTRFYVSGHVSGATVQVQKKPSGAFGALLGNSAAKRKFGPDKKATEEIKLEQIKSLVNLPFHSFASQTEHLKPLKNQHAESQEIEQLAKPLERELTSVTSACSNSRDVILLESNSDNETPVIANSTSENLPADASKSVDVIMLESDSDNEIPIKSDGVLKSDMVERAEEENEEGKPVSLSDLSSSFEKCMHQMSQAKSAKQSPKESELKGLKKVKPFDYDTARKNIRFGEEREDIRVADDEGYSEKGSKKKNLIVGRTKGGEGMAGDFLPGKRRQAFPSSGNRSATFR